MKENEFIYYLDGFLQGNGLKDIEEEKFINLKDKLDSVVDKGNFCLWLDGCFSFNKLNYIKEDNVCIIYDKLKEVLKIKNEATIDREHLDNHFSQAKRKPNIFGDDDFASVLIKC